MFVDEVIKIVDLTITAVYDFNENPNEKEYVDDLKKVIIELYACLTFALSNAKANRGLYNYYTNIATFVVRTCNFNANPKIVILY